MLKDVYVTFDKFVEQVAAVEDGLIRKIFLEKWVPDYIEFHEGRYFMSYPFKMSYIATRVRDSAIIADINDKMVDFVSKLESDQYWHADLPIYAAHVNIVDFIDSRIDDFITYSISEDDFIRDANLPVIVNSDRSGAFPIYGEIPHVYVSTREEELPSTAFLATADRTYVYMSSPKGPIRLGDYDPDVYEYQDGDGNKSYLNTYVYKPFMMGNTTLYPFKWDNY